jgi:hypothetical protein
MTSHHQKPIDYCDAYLNLKLRLSLATCVDPIDYANWVRDKATQLCLGFDLYMRANEGDIHPSEQVDEMSVYGRMQFVRATGRDV